MKKYMWALALCWLAFHGAAAEKDLFNEERIIETNKAVELTSAPIPVEPGQKHQISFLARAGGEATLEANERIRMMNLRDMAGSVRAQFLDEQGGNLSFMDMAVISREFHDYARVFYPPARARALKLLLRPAMGADLAVKKITVSAGLEGPEGECLNVHPTFERGDLNGYGYASGYGGGFYTRPDGKTVWNSGFLGYTPSFPVKGDTFHDFYGRGKKYRGRKSSMELECYKPDDPNNHPFKTMAVAIGEKGETTTLKIPAGVVTARLRCYYVILEEFKATGSKGEK